ncbi:S1C family serine protease [Gryllotalpicola reticulitermitis]|uniref:S1C family serine protease n=1 Tax=Gryllotalpicola reticulitermitis TaxID=1184153 RepID=A0ABV8QC96_9MICO
MSDNANDHVDPQNAHNSAANPSAEGESVHEPEPPQQGAPEWQAPAAPAQPAESTVVFDQPQQPAQPPQPVQQQPAQQQPMQPPQPAAPDYSQPRPRWGEYAQQTPPQPAPQAPQPGQPYQGQYPQQTQPYPQGYQQNQNTQPTQPLGGQHPYYSQFSAPAPQAPKPAKPKGERSLSNRSILLIVAGLVVGGLIGGGVGGGIAAGVAHNSGTPVNISSGSGASNITVNDPKNVTQVTAVAAKASNSVVTINVTGSQESGTGSGVILSSDGYILTNTHVVTLDGDTSSVTIQVQTNDGKLYAAKVIGTDPTDDLAVIKLSNASGLSPINWGSSSKLNVGDQVIAIGAPLGLQGTVTDGIVSALNRSVSLQSSAAPSDGSGSGSGGSQNPFGSSNPFDQGQQSSSSDMISVPAIQTDAAINPGNSGGALLNDSGQLVGINVAIASTGSSDGSTQSGNIGVGFAIPADVAHRIADELKANGKATHGLLGATVSNAAAQSNATTVGGRIESVNSGSAASKAGLKAGDVITNVGGVPVTSADDLTAQIRSSAAGATVKVTYVRDGKTYQANVTLGTYTAPQQ